MKVGAIILAGGTSSRFGADVPKQFVNLNGKAIWKHAYETFKSHPKIGSIVVVFPQSYCDNPENDIYGMNIAFAGKTRRESSYNGLRALKAVWSDCEYVLIHDAARPLVSHEIISACIERLHTDYAVDVTVPSPDSIVELMENNIGEISRVVNRSQFRLGQTPQAFSMQMILDAHANVANEEFTDDLGIFIRRYPAARVANVNGEERNMKITTQADLIKAERLARLVPEESTKLPMGSSLIFGGTGGIGSEVVKRLQGIVCPVTMVWGREQCKLSGNHDALYKIEQEFLDYMVISVGSLKEAHPDTDFNQWDDEFDDNFTHIARFLGTVKRRGIMKRGGSIVVVGSSSAYQGRSTYTAYSAGKAALVNFVQGFAEEWPDVRLNIVNPARTATDMRKKMFPDEKGLLLSPEEVAQRIVRVLGMPCTGRVFDVRANGIDV